LKAVDENTDFKRRASEIEKDRVEIAALSERVKRLVKRRGAASGSNADAFGKIFIGWLETPVTRTAANKKAASFPAARNSFLYCFLLVPVFFNSSLSFNS
jgi:hypothetical protein